MISATVLGVIFAPVFFVFVMKLTGTHKRLGSPEPEQAEPSQV
jgi:multidrug efflux pump